MVSKGNRMIYANCDGNKIVGGISCGLYGLLSQNLPGGRGLKNPLEALIILASSSRCLTLEYQEF
jgi:hypothetical protein